MPDKGAGSDREFSLLETILWEPDSGYFLLDEHVWRLNRAAMHFEFTIDDRQVQRQLQAVAGSLPPQPHRVRLLVDSNGRVTAQPLMLTAADDSAPWRVAVAEQPVDSNDIFLRHKTTRRQVYEAAKAAHPTVDDVLLWNERGELTERTLANVVVQLDDELLTPPVRCGLLPGVFRQQLLLQGIIHEQAIQMEELPHCDQIYLINSVRRWVEAEVVG